MKRKDLLQAMGMLYPITSDRPVLEEMADFKIDGDTLCCTDGVSKARAKLPETTGISCRIKAGLLYKLLQSLACEDVKLKLDGNKLTVKGGKAKATYNVSTEPSALDELEFDVDEWAKLPKGLVDGISLCRFATSGDVSRGALCGIYIYGKGIIASDGARIAGHKSRVTIEKPVVISESFASQIAKYKDKITGWAVKDDVVYFKVGESTVIASKAMAYEYPEDDVGKVLAKVKELKGKVKLPKMIKEVLDRHLSQQQFINQDEEKDVTVKFSGDKLEVQSTDGIYYELEDTIELAGATDGTFKVHPRFFAEVLDKTDEMLYGEGVGMVGFVHDGFTYIVGVEPVE